MELYDHAESKLVSAAAAQAIERLLDLHELDNSSDMLARRSARRLCGRWLMMRRLQRGLSIVQVAERIAVEPELLRMLEQGLADLPLVPDSAWERLGLVLEGYADDYHHVALVARTACGVMAEPDPAWLRDLAEALEHEPTPFDLPALDVPAASTELLRDADQLVRDASQQRLPRHNMLVLQALRRTQQRPLSIARIKLELPQLDRNVDLNVGEVRELLQQLQAAGLVERVAVDAPDFRITALGNRTCVAALRQCAAQSDLRIALQPLLQNG
ncbi:MAG: hypothetical protein HC822_16680 [Oscillochloris sp.]|nr:hypothetical protein [Oscillochloris sp.]